MNKELFIQVREWAAARNIIKGATAVSQFAKLISEHGELSGHILEYNDIGANITFKPGEDISPETIVLMESLKEKMADDIGDSLVVLTIIGAQMEVNIEDIKPDSIEGGNSVLLLNVAYGMLADAILKKDIESFCSLISTIFSLLSEVATQLNKDLDYCLSAAYEDIKDRKGVMFNGTFIKSTDERYEAVMKELSLS